MASYSRAAPRIQVVPTDDFQGGLNLNADPFQLKDNESPDVWNVDFDPLGGFKQRDGVAYVGASGPTLLTSDPKSMWVFCTPDGGTQQLMVQQGNEVYWTSNPSPVSSWTASGSSAPWNVTVTGTMRAATFRDPANLTTSACYIQRNTEQLVVKWTGSVASTLADPAVSTPAWNEDFAAPARGKMPKAKFVTTHRDFVFVASTVEYEAAATGTVAHTSRVRWSHPGQPEDWRKNDWIDVEPGSNDAITGIASWGDRLLIFKNNAVFELLGYDADSFEVVNLSRTIGALSQDAIAVSEQGVYFFSWPEGVHFWDGKNISNLFFQLRPMVYDGTVNRAARQKITVQWARQRVWVSVPTQSNTVNSQTFVFDPMLNRGRGGWTRYKFGDYGLGVGVEYQPPAGDAKWLAVYAGNFSGTYSVVELHSKYYSTNGLPLFYDYLDPRSPGSWTKPILTRYQTPWIDLGNPALVKAWRRPVFVCRADVDFTLSCQGYRDYDDSLPAGSPFTISSVAAAVGGVWDSALWDQASWATDGNRREIVQKGARLGRATSVCLVIEGPQTFGGQTPWTVDSITWKYIPKRIRS